MLNHLSFFFAVSCRYKFSIEFCKIFCFILGARKYKSENYRRT